MAISSAGIGSGLDVNSIVSQLVAIEKQPLKALESKANNYQVQLSMYGTIQSQVSALGDAAAALANAQNWAAQKATSSNTAAVTVTASSTAVSTAFSLDVTQLARAQTTASQNVAVNSTLGTASDNGTLTINTGSWATGSFVAGTGSVAVSINGADTFTTIASKINAANTGVTATVLRSGGQERLSFQSSTTGEAAGFQIASAGFTGLDSLSFTSQAATASATGMQSSQTGLDAQVKINGVAVTSATNTLTNVVPGLTLQLAQVTTAPVQVTVANDKEAMQKSIQAFADAYSALNRTIAADTKYVPGGTSGALQGDSTTVGIQTVMRSILGSSSVGSTFSRLSDIGLEQQADGSLKLNTTKLGTAMADMTNLQKLFTTDNSNSATNGFALKFRDVAKGLVAAGGTVTNKTAAIQGAINRNSDEQDRVTERAGKVEKQLRAQYSALDAQMAKMTALSSYVTAQLAQWNKA
ncbi:MAG: flagellar filament capping protein FliD [Rhodoferax sp.]